MKMIQYYSHLNGLEFLIVHKSKLWQEILKVIEKVDSSTTLTKISSEKTKKGKLLYSPSALNSLFKDELTNIVREGRSNPSVPIILIGVAP